MKKLLKRIFKSAFKDTSLKKEICEIIEYQTNLTEEYNHPEIVIRISSPLIPKNDITTIINWLECEIRNGVSFEAGQKLQLGFMVTEFQSLLGGRLILEEPDMKSFPIIFTPTLNMTFKTLRRQKDVVESLEGDIPPDFPSIMQGVVVHNNYKKHKSIMLERTPPEGEQSGWWVHVKGKHKTKNYMSISLYQLALDRPELVKYLGLPVNSKTTLHKGLLTSIELADNKMNLIEGSFLSEFTSSKETIK
jgi:hypothetical protein